MATLDWAARRPAIGAEPPGRRYVRAAAQVDEYGSVVRVDVAVERDAAGTADLPVAEEVELVARLLGARTQLIVDVGVAGLHRLLAELPALATADAIVVVAGMEGALASVVGGLAAVPVIACPTSVGYGANLGGLTALLAMISSCAPGVAVVNVDDGVGAATIGALIARGRER